MNDYGVLFIQARDRFLAELCQRIIDRARQMRPGKLLGRQNFNEMCAFIDSLLQLVAAYNDLRHRPSSSN
ncbi:MAG TPA: hypothetical protein VF182_01095 [Candidatus Binatia bacterium]